MSKSNRPGGFGNSQYAAACHVSRLASLVLAAWLASTLSGLPAQSATPHNRTEITLTLKWEHQFQFAGYYAAIEQGYYQEEDLEVSLVTPLDGLFPLHAVLEGKADFGIGSADLLPARAAGKPLVLVASIFQHSAIILLSRKDSLLLLPSDYSGKTIMANPSSYPEIQLMFLREGVDISNIHLVPATSLEELISGRYPAAVHYLTNEPALLRLAGAEPYFLRPIEYGIDFYGDSIFTTENLAHGKPQLVEAFKRASLRGWDYAMKNQSELIDYILNLPGVRQRGKTAELLAYEAEQMQLLIQPELIELGHINPARWQRMADSYAEVGLLPAGFNIDDFIFTPDFGLLQSRLVLRRVLLVSLLIILLLAVVLAWNWQLRRAIRRKTVELAASKAYLQDIFNACPDPIFIHETETGSIIDINQAVCRQFGCSREEALSSSIADISAKQDPYDQASALRLLRKTKEEGPQLFEWLSRRMDGSTFWGEVSTSYSQIGEEKRFIVVERDISDRKAAEAATRQRLAETEMLLKEVHHRIKNNLAAIRSIINLQASEASEAPVRAALEAAAGRIESMHILYEKLLNNSDYQNLSIGVYIRDLTVAILNMNQSKRLPRMAIQIDDLQLDSRRLFLIGGIINEFMTNSLKHAGSEEQDLSIEIELGIESGEARLLLRDNGPGYPAEQLGQLEAGFDNKHSFGLALIGIMAVQLNGLATLENRQGACCLVRFPAE